MVPDDNWIKWEGGECPVDLNTRVETLLRDGTIDVDPAYEWDWGRFTDDSGNDIVAYRVVQ